LLADMSCKTVVLSALAISGATALSAGRGFLAQNAEMQPDRVAKTLMRVEQEWRSQAIAFSECSAGEDCSGAAAAFQKSCSTVVSAVVQASSGDRDNVVEYMHDVCTEIAEKDWRHGRCTDMGKLIAATMKQDAYENRENFDTAGLCTKFWARVSKEEAARVEQEQKAQAEADAEAAKADEAARAAETKRQAEEEAKAAEASKKAEEAAKVADAAAVKATAEEEAAKALEEKEAKQAQEKNSKKDAEAKEEVEVKDAVEASNATVVLAANSTNATVVFAANSTNATVPAPAVKPAVVAMPAVVAKSTVVAVMANKTA